jgi:hypothetical protein
LSNLSNKVTMMFTRLLRNRKGTAEVIGSVLFIIILLFFFTNVYLWHDAATKEMNDMYAQKLNSPIAITVSNPQTNQYTLNITNKGGVDATLSWVWINEKSPSGAPDVFHTSLNTIVNVVVEAGGSKLVTISYAPQNSGDPLLFKVVTTTGNSASFTLR